MSRAAIVVGVVVAAGVLGGCGQAPATSEMSAAPVAPASATGPSPTPAGPTTRTINVTVRDGQVSGETGRVEVPLGTPVTLAVTSDVADEIHLHGYDLAAPIPAGGVGSVSFTATIPGVFEMELHESGRQLLQLQVS